MDPQSPRTESPPTPDIPQPDYGRQPGGQRAKGAHNRRGGKPLDGDERRRRKSSGERRSAAGFGDSVERAFCLFIRHRPPPSFPVQSRGGVATIAPVVVARRPDAILLCDLEHDGDHSWPDGDTVLEVEG
jgi:hypothetical protein